ncbi:MAG: radical SAM protein [Lentisphaerae bacterium]|nr:radical SAM protein [Lentisphaerota bacterium]
MIKKYVFGPVTSRRLGCSLGVDMVPLKTCPLDCIYCEARATTLLTMERREYVPVDVVLKELEETLSPAPQLDYITFSGSGEPTLNSRIGDVVDFLKSRYPQYKVCLLTNGLLLGDAKLQQEIEKIDLLIPSLDGSNAAEYEAVNRPVAEMPFDKFIAVLKDYLPRAPMPVHLELFITPGINDSDESIGRFAEIIGELQVDRVQLNTLDRPGAVKDLKCADEATVIRFMQELKSITAVEAVGKYSYLN